MSDATIVATLDATFFASPVQTALTIAALVCVTVYCVVGPILSKRSARRTLDRALLAAYPDFVDPLFVDHAHQLEGIGWGTGQTILACPLPQDGWSTGDISFRVNRSPYSFASLQGTALPGIDGQALARDYERFVTEEFPQQFASDEAKWMLVRRPRSFTEDLGVTLELQRTSWSQLQFFWQKVVSADTKPFLYTSLLRGDSIPFPSSLCAHVIVFSADGRVLLTRAHASKRNDYPGYWACSIGEQLATEDIASLDDDCARRWVTRSLREELAVDQTEFDAAQIRFLALTFEGDIANLAMVCSVHLHLSAADVDARLRTVNRVDNEFGAIDFIEVDRIPEEMVNPSRTYHPSTGIRMVYAYLSQRGQHSLRKRLAVEVAANRSVPRSRVSA